MTPIPAPPSLALLTILMRSVLATLAIPDDATAKEFVAWQEGATQAVASLQPTTPLQAMLACRVVTATFAAMECQRRFLLKDLPHNTAVRYQATAISLTRSADVALRELLALQFEARQQAEHAQKPAAASPEAASPAQPAAATRNERQHPMPSGAPTAPAAASRAQPAAAALNERQHPMPSGAPISPPRPVVELPPGPPHPSDVWIAEASACRAATAAGNKSRAT